MRRGAPRRASSTPSRAATSAMKRAPSSPLGAHLEVRVARAGERAGAEQRAAQVGAAAARAADDALRRLLERRARRGEHTRLAQHVERALVDVDVQLVARRLVERAARVRADLRAHAEVAQQREGAPGGGRAREVEVHRDRRRRAGARRPTRGRAPRARRAGSSAAPARSARARRAGHRRATPSSSSSRRLYSTPRSPQLADPVRGDDAVHGQERRELAAGAERSGRARGARVAGERRELAVGHDLAAGDPAQRAGAVAVEPASSSCSGTSANRSGSPAKNACSRGDERHDPSSDTAAASARARQLASGRRGRRRRATPPPRPSRAPRTARASASFVDVVASRA